MPRLVLIAVGDAVAAALYTAVLELHGFEIETSLDGLEAVDIAIARRPSLVILDDDLPSLRAASICAILKQTDTTRHIPLVVVTNESTSRLQYDLIANAGADHIFAASCAPELLALEAVRLSRAADISILT
ncbi:MAG TPA: response regulator [Vicinamibacterales bacterium]